MREPGKVKALGFGGKKVWGVAGCGGAWLAQQLPGLAADTVAEAAAGRQGAHGPRGPGFCSGQPQARESQRSQGDSKGPRKPPGERQGGEKSPGSPLMSTSDQPGGFFTLVLPLVKWS